MPAPLALLRAGGSSAAARCRERDVGRRESTQTSGNRRDRSTSAVHDSGSGESVSLFVDGLESRHRRVEPKGTAIARQIAMPGASG
jgi:hypothetical protein